MNAEQKKQYLELERSLSNKCGKMIRHNELVLTSNDFEEGKLSSTSFVKLKDECWYIPYADEVVIKAPKGYGQGLMDSLEQYGYRELNKIKTERNENRIHALVIFLVGLAVLGIAFGIEYLYNIPILMEFFIIISWIFIWAAVHKLFFDNRSLKDMRFTILQLLSAKIEVVGSDTV